MRCRVCVGILQEKTLQDLCQKSSWLVPFDGINYPDDDDDRPLCYECFTGEVQKAKPIHDYYFKPEPIFHGSGPRFFGVELEIDEGGEFTSNAKEILDAGNAGGDILKISAGGEQEWEEFDASTLYFRYCHPYYGAFSLFDSLCPAKMTSIEDSYIEDLKTAAQYYGYDERCIDQWLEDGFSTDDIEDFLYYGEM